MFYQLQAAQPLRGRVAREVLKLAKARFAASSAHWEAWDAWQPAVGGFQAAAERDAWVAWARERLPSGEQPDWGPPEEPAGDSAAAVASISRLQAALVMGAEHASTPAAAAMGSQEDTART